eukprot:3149551-Amphidinium_carterae.1
MARRWGFRFLGSSVAIANPPFALLWCRDRQYPLSTSLLAAQRGRPLATRWRSDSAAWMER